MLALAVLLCTCAADAICAQAVRFHVGQSVLIASGTEYEPHLAVDPANPNHLVAAAIVGVPGEETFEERMGKQRCAAFVSFDGGLTWARHDFSTTWCFDPWVVIAPGGEVVITMVAAHASLSQQGRTGLLLFRSKDGGRSWDDLPLGLGRNHDHPTMAIDLSTSARRGWIYLTSHRPSRAENGHLRHGLYTMRSRDGGRTFDDPVYLIPNNLWNLPEMPAALGDGTLVVSFVDASYPVDSAGAKSADVTFERRRAWIVRSSDGGYTFSSPLFVTDACGPPPDYRLSAFAADVSTSRFAGHLYFACRRKGAGPIVVSSSRDRGESWVPATAVRSGVSDSVSVARIPGLAVNDRGTVAVAWIDGSGQRSNPCEQHVYLSVSLDGGRTFTPGQLISQSADCGTGGDYFGLVGLRDGRFRLLWSGTRDGRTELRTVEIEVSDSAEGKR